MANETAKIQVLSYDGDTLVIDFQKIGKKYRIDTSKLPHQEYARKHGWKQRFGDLKSGDTQGNEKLEEVKRLHHHLLGGGDWNMSGERDTTAIVVEALHRIDSKKYPKAKLLAAAEKKPELVKEWRSAPKVKAMIAKIYAERAEAAAAEAEEQDVEINLE